MADALSNSGTTAPTRVIGRPFLPGVSGNPGGRPVGSRNKINADFLRELADHFAEHGRDAIERMCHEEPAAYIKVVASLLPKGVTIEARPLDQFTEEELAYLIEVLERRVADDLPSGVGATIDGTALPAPDERS